MRIWVGEMRIWVGEMRFRVVGFVSDTARYTPSPFLPSCCVLVHSGLFGMLMGFEPRPLIKGEVLEGRVLESAVAIYLCAPRDGGGEPSLSETGDPDWSPSQSRGDSAINRR
jgi:hypothetical protein